jgi:hypothetical protein
MKIWLMSLACLWLLIGCATSTSRVISTPKPSPLGTSTIGSSGPTVYLRDDSGEPPINPISSLMYFVKLISPEPVDMSKSVGNTQQSRILSVNKRVDSGKLTTTCRFEIIGQGTQQNIFNQTVAIRKNRELLKNGGTLKRRLDYINIEGTGKGSLQVEGIISDDLPLANKFTFRFNDQGQRSPVTIGIYDIRWIDGSPHAINETMIRVGSLTFRRQEGRPKMGVTVASIKSKNAGDGLLSNLAGKVKGTLANMFIPPVYIKTEGNDALLDFAQAIVEGRRQFTFPAAR